MHPHTTYRLTNSPSLCPQRLTKIQTAAEQLYGLFPNRQTLIDAARLKAPLLPSLCHQAVQASLGAPRSQRKHSSEGFRTQVKINDYLDRIERAHKFRKTVEVKEL